MLLFVFIYIHCGSMCKILLDKYAYLFPLYLIENNKHIKNVSINIRH